jgi:hypothetical protein
MFENENGMPPNPVVYHICPVPKVAVSKLAVYFDDKFPFPNNP